MNFKTTPRPRGKGWFKAGVAGVDSGLIMISDPCYSPVEKAGSWDKFCDQLNGATTQLFFPAGHVGQGVVTSTGFGDGCYEVWARKKTIPGWGERITEVRVIFI